MTEMYQGGCLCGKHRYRTKGNPMRVSVCHCKFCQRRTGSTCGIAVFFPEENVKINGNDLALYEHVSDESGLKIGLEFCRRCGTTITAKLERFPTGRVTFGGTFDDPSWFTIERHIWTRSAPSWMVFPENIPCFQKSASANLRSPGSVSRRSRAKSPHKRGGSEPAPITCLNVSITSRSRGTSLIAFS